tara:strand:- start:41 stop:268 length:228 start_codon:yes stop_codon:yes gene_type:complete
MMNDNIVLEIKEKDALPDTSNDEALARALFQEEQISRNKMFYDKSVLSREETRTVTRINAENRHRINRFKMQFSR